MATHAADVVVLGAGPAGYVCAIRLAQLGKKVTVVERGMVGGVCLNVGCIPSKALIYAGTQFEKLTKHGSEMGFELKGEGKVNFPKMMEYKSGVVKKLTGGVAQLLKANGCNLLIGEAKFTGPKTLELKTDKGTDTVTFNVTVDLKWIRSVWSIRPARSRLRKSPPRCFASVVDTSGLSLALSTRKSARK